MSKLPDQFAELEARWGHWIIENEPDRVKIREKLPLEELNAFYFDIISKIDSLLAHLDQFPVDDLPHQELNLWWMLSSFAGVGMTLELYASQKAIPGGYILSDVSLQQKGDSHKLLQ